MNTADSDRYSLSRRHLLQLGGAGALAASVSGCGIFSGDDTDAPGDGAKKGKEAPMLAERVQAGDLPPVEDRLPATPLVIEPVDSTGAYGGSWNTAILGSEDVAQLDRTIGYDYLVTWNRDWTGVLPNVAESFSVADDGREFTFKLREGMRWSDGELFTADDIVFAFEDVLNNMDLHPTGPPSSVTSTDGTPATIEKVSDYEVKFVFTTPKGMFLEELAIPDSSGGRFLTGFPRHYLEQFHEKYGENVEELATKEGFRSWVELFLAKSADLVSKSWTNFELPTLFPWVLTSNVGDGSELVAERNPYYWKTDPDGSQLPYIDRVTFEVIGDPQTMILRATSGELNMHARHFNSLTNKPVLASSREEGNYDFFDLIPPAANVMVIILNLTHEDPNLREVFQNKEFRIGLSHAINREEINTAVFQDQGTPWQVAPKEESSFYDEEFAHQYLEYDESTANEHLDRAGYSQRDGEGFRLGPNGQRIAFTVEIANPAITDAWVPSMELVRGYWAAVGIDITLQNEDRSLWSERVSANKHDATVWNGPGGLDYEAILSGHHYLPYHAGSRFAILWFLWYQSGGANGEEPPEPARRQLELYDTVLATADGDERNRLFREILQIAKEEFYDIGTINLTQGYGIVANNFHNVPASMPDAFLWPMPGPSRPEQYFIS